MDRGRTVALWIIADILILICVPIAHYIYLDRLLDYEYSAGIRKSTSGDIILLPVIGGFILLLFLVIVVNALAAIIFWIRRHRNAEAIEKNR